MMVTKEKFHIPSVVLMRDLFFTEGLHNVKVRGKLYSMNRYSHVGFGDEHNTIIYEFTKTQLKAGLRNFTVKCDETFLCKNVSLGSFPVHGAV